MPNEADNDTPQAPPPGPNQTQPPENPDRPPSSPENRVPTGQHKQPTPKKTTDSSVRRTQILSLEPPRRKRTTSLAQNTRLDAMVSPTIAAQRQRALMGNIGREQQTRAIPKGDPGKTTTKPQLRRSDTGKAVELGGTNKRVMEQMIQRRKTTRVIPKDGDLAGDGEVLNSMGSNGQRITGATTPEMRERPPHVPPVVKMPVPQPKIQRKRDSAPAPLGARGNTLGSVSAEELLGEEGRKLLETMRQREIEAQRNPTIHQPQKPGTPLGPRMHDSSLLAFQAAEYSDEKPIENETSADTLHPQSNFLGGPSQGQGQVLQTPVPADEGDESAPDDLGYERPVDYGDEAARDSAAHEEMEQRAGYLLWLQGVITREEVAEALTDAADVPDGVRELLMNSNYADQETLYRFLARHETLSPVDLERTQPSERALATLRPAIARSYRVVPLERVGELLLVAAAWPFDPKRLLELRRLTSSKVKLFIVTEEEIDAALLRYYPPATDTLRSPPVSDRTDPGDDEIDGVTGEGEALSRRYDPTLSGEESGLYAPVDQNPFYSAEEVEDSEFDSHAETAEFEVVPDGPSQDAEQAGEYEALDEGDQEGADDGSKKKVTEPRASGGDELDPFGD